MKQTSYVDFTTNFGDIVIQLFNSDAPLTVQNFLNYANNMTVGGGYDGSFFHRLVAGFVLQGGGYDYTSLGVTQIATAPPVVNEFSELHPNVKGTVAMAKLGSNPNSATDQFFFNLGDNSANLDLQNGGFTVFGQVTAASWPVVQAIAALPVVNASSPFDSLPVTGTIPSTGPVAANLVIISTTRVATDVIGADFNNDGKSDLLLQNTNGTGLIEIANGLGGLTGVAIGNPGPTWHLLGSADFNGDGQADLLYQNDNGSIVDYLMNGTAISAGYNLGNPGSAWHYRGAGDFNADGKADLLLQNDNGSLVILETNGTNLVGSALVGTLPAGAAVEAVADFNGDGMPDILVQTADGTLVDFTMQGTGIAAGNVIGNPGAGYSVAGTGDYNADGKADILLHNDNGVDVVWEMNGPTVTASVFAGNPGANQTGIVAGVDLDGDTNSDLVIQDPTTGTLIGYTLNNNATITAGAVLGAPGAGWNVVGSNPTTFLDGTGATLALSGTPGPDQFVLTSYAAGVHTIAGSDPAQDRIALSLAAFPSYAAVQANEAAYQGGTFINLSPTAAIVIQGVTPGQLSAADFVLR